jgi:archaellum biogenesis ATPase FlaH
MNLASALIKQIIELDDFDTWASLKRHYLPAEFHGLYDAISKQVDQYHKLPSMSDLEYSTRDGPLLDKVNALKLVEVDSEPFLLLDYLKNEFTQKEVLNEMYRYVSDTIAFETAEETLTSLYDLISRVESKVELVPPEDTLQGMSLFDSEEELANFIPLGLNAEFDSLVRFKQSDYILMGGKRGAGKSVTCSNLANTVYASGKSVLYFSIEMPTKEILQRQAAIGAQVPHSKIKYKSLEHHEMLRVVEWWANRYENADKHIAAYKEHRCFDKFHKLLIQEPLKPAQLHVVYDPSLTLPKLKAEVIKMVRKLGNVGLVIVDYVNQIKRTSSSDDKFDWKDQIHVSTALKELAGQLQVPFFSPYQIDASGEARFAKGILDSADAAFTLEAGEDQIAFTCTKIRGDAKIHFSSKVNWSTLTIGPENGNPVIHDPEDEPAKGKSFRQPKKEEDVPVMDMNGIYDDLPF